ncbi:MAG TPA: PPOX class F420-dependent oxidoreductase [bacterium]|nr:PPOX class F420-dependent oxidoreductase [bacterium]
MAAGTPLAAALDDHRYALLTTFRRTGRPVTTPVWFAVAGGAVYFRTGAWTGKAKRLRRNERVRVAPGTARGRPLGPDIDATARPLGPEESEVARRALEQRYGFQVRLVDLLFRLRREQPLFFEVSPA